MAKGKSFFAFIAGAAVGAAAAFLALTETGNEMFESGCKSIKKGVKDVEDIINRLSADEDQSQDE